MFGFFKKKPTSVPPYADKRWFIAEIFDKIREVKDPNAKLEKYIDFYDRVRDLESEFEIECLELSFELDEIRNAFYDCTDPEVLVTCAVAYDHLKGHATSIAKLCTERLPDHLKVRLLKTYVLSVLDHESVDPRELEPALQHAFYEVEQRGISESEMVRVLEQEFGIVNWRTRREMNPGVIYD